MLKGGDNSEHSPPGWIHRCIAGMWRWVLLMPPSALFTSVTTFCLGGSGRPGLCYCMVPSCSAFSWVITGHLLMSPLFVRQLYPLKIKSGVPQLLILYSVKGIMGDLEYHTVGLAVVCQYLLSHCFGQMNPVLRCLFWRLFRKEP